MASGRVTSARERDRVSALAMGLAATVMAWTFAAAFAPGELQAVSGYSPWLYGPVAISAWALFSTIAYLLICRDQRRRVQLEPREPYRCRDFATAASLNCNSVCASLEEKIRLASISAGLGLTVMAWVAALSFMPGPWLDWLSKTPRPTCCIVSIALWLGLSKGMYLVFRASRERWVEAG